MNFLGIFYHNLLMKKSLKKVLQLKAQESMLLLKLCNLNFENISGLRLVSPIQLAELQGLGILVISSQGDINMSSKQPSVGGNGQKYPFI